MRYFTKKLYRHALGYEAHILSGIAGKNGLELRDTKIICSEILFEE